MRYIISSCIFILTIYIAFSAKILVPALLRHKTRISSFSENAAACRPQMKSLAITEIMQILLPYKKKQLFCTMAPKDSCFAFAETAYYS